MKKLWNTIKSTTWRAAVSLNDGRLHLRRITGQRQIDVVCVTNMRDNIDRMNFLGGWRPKCGHFNGPRYWIKGINARTRALDVTAQDLKTPEGRAQARIYFLDAVRWAQQRGVLVILLAAGTKRLFEETKDFELTRQFPEWAERIGTQNGDLLTSLFPGIVFTIGDNGTVLLLEQETRRALRNSGLSQAARIAVFGPDGFLGDRMVQCLLDAGFTNLVGVATKADHMAEVASKYGIATFTSLEDMGRVDGVVACSHSDTVRLTAERVEMIRPADRKLFLVDVAEPNCMPKEEYLRCSHLVWRQNAGNAFSPFLQYVLGALSYSLFRLSRGITFGCFAEALAIAWAIKNCLLPANPKYHPEWFEVTEEKIMQVVSLFTALEFQMPDPPYNYTRRVKDYDLFLSAAQTTITSPAPAPGMAPVHH